VIDLGFEKGRDHIEKIDIPAMFSDPGDEILESGEFSNQVICYFKVCLFVVFKYLAYFVLYSAVRIVFRLVDPFGANWLDSQLPCFLGVDSCQCVIEQD